MATSVPARAGGLPSVSGQSGGPGATFPDGVPLPSALPVDGASLSVSSVAVPALRAGETLQVSAQAEVTDDVIVRSGGDGFRWLSMPLTSELVLASSPEATTGIVLAPADGGLISWREHHAAIVRSSMFTVPPALGGASLYVNLVLRSAPAVPPSGCYDYDRSTGVFAPSSAGCRLHVENDDGLVDLTVTRTPPSGDTSYSATLTPGAATDAYLPIPFSSSSPEYGQQRVVWSSGPIGNIHTGDVLEASAQVQASIESLVRSIPTPNSATTGCNVMLSGQLFLSPYPDRLPAAADPLANAVPALGDDYAFNLTQSEPRTLAAWHATWTADSDYTSPQVPVRYVVLAVWAAGSQACQSAVTSADPGLHVESGQSSGFALHFAPAAGTSSYAAWSVAGGNATAELLGRRSPRVIAVVPVHLDAGEILTASAQAAIESAASADTDVQLVLGSTYRGPSDVSGTALASPGRSVSDPESDRSLITLAGALSVGADDAGAGLRYVKLIGWSSSTAPVQVDPHTTQLLVRLIRAGSAPTRADLPTPPPTLTSAASRDAAIASMARLRRADRHAHRRRRHRRHRRHRRRSRHSSGR